MKDLGQIFDAFNTIPKSRQHTKTLFLYEQKYKIDFKEIKKQRKFKSVLIYERLEEQHNLREQSGTRNNHLSFMGKVRFLNKFFLFSSISKFQHNQVKNIKTVEEHIVNNFDCNPRWPVCLYDFTFKNQCSQFINYRQAYKPQPIENYFDMIDESKPVHPPGEDFDEILIEREQHMCLDRDFVKAFRILFTEHNTEFFETDTLTFNISNPLQAKAQKKKFMDFCKQTAKPYFEEMKEEEGGVTSPQ